MTHQLSEKLLERTRKCADCGHEWLKRSPKDADPKRCPNHQCRSKKWKIQTSMSAESKTGEIATLRAVLEARS